MQIVVATIPAQEVITRDNVTMRVDAVVYYRVVARVQAGNLLTTGGAYTSHSGVVCLVAGWC